LKGRIVALLIAAVLVVGIVLLLNRGGERHLDQGAVHFLGSTTPAFEPFIAKQDPAYGAFLRRHVWRMLVYSPHFDERTRWYPNGLMYEDAYAIYRGSIFATRHPEWILRDAGGNPLYIPFGCSNGRCPQYAADISNPALRRHWIATVQNELRRGYRGVFIDDVNMDLRVSNGREQSVAPIDRATHRPMTASAWRSYMAQFMEEIRRALPHTEIVHNAIWYAGSPTGIADPSIRREIGAADFINLERGVNDSGLTGGSGTFSLQRMLRYIDAVHALGKGVILEGSATDLPGTEYALAAYLLISSGKDAVSAGGMTPIHWWPGFDVNLGEALGPRRLWSGVLRRDFTRGMTLVNEPGVETRRVQLPTAMRELNGRVVTSVSLPPATGVVLLHR
jgi:putative glycosyl hydrolase-like family 15 (GHL15) protein